MESMNVAGSIQKPPNNLSSYQEPNNQQIQQNQGGNNQSLGL